MDRPVQKRRVEPTEVCQYGKLCYRKNPHHFMEYAHDHLSEIIKQNGSNAVDAYQTPADLQRELILDQVKIIVGLFPHLAMHSSAKKPKADADGTPTAKVAAPAGSSSSSVVDLTADSFDGGRASKPQPIQSQSTASQPLPGQSYQGQPQTAKAPSQPSEPNLNINMADYVKVVRPKGQMAQKLAASAPYNYFLTAIPSSKPTHSEPLTITFQEILDPSLGDLECSVQINFMIDIGWLLAQYYFAGHMSKPMLVLYGADMPELQMISQKKPNVTTHMVQMGNPFATHHTKMMLLGYKDQSMRVVVSTANLYEDDWHNRTQGLWMSDRLPALPDGVDTSTGESATGFRNDLLKYLSSYRLPHLQSWLVRVRKTDFSSINVFLVTSIPGTYSETLDGFPHGHGRVAHLLSKHTTAIEDGVPVVAQSSSLGSFGQSPAAWLASEFVHSFRRDTRPIGLRQVPPIRVIYPSFNNVVQSHDGLIGGGCLPYGNQVHQKQLWLQDFLYQWKANVRHRSKAMPHIKTYARWQGNRLFWFVLTSANISKAAWGSLSKTKTNPTLRVNNYEAGVLFVPKFVTKTEHFSLDASDASTPVFPQLYDIPLTKYSIDDTAFVSDLLFDK